MTMELKIDPTKEGTICPYCSQFIKLYERTLTSSMAYGLILIYKKQKLDDSYLHIENFFKDINHLPSSIRGDISKLRYWKLLERKEGERKDKSRRNGYYKITQRGRLFVENNLKVPSNIKVYNNHFMGFSGEIISIKEALKNKFSYEKLMS